MKTLKQLPWRFSPEYLIHDAKRRMKGAGSCILYDGGEFYDYHIRGKKSRIPRSSIDGILLDQVCSPTIPHDMLYLFLKWLVGVEDDMQANASIPVPLWWNDIALPASRKIDYRIVE